MLFLLPVFSFGLTFIILLAKRSEKHPTLHGWQADFLIASAFWGVLVVIFSEILSIGNTLSQFWLALCWATVILILLIIVIRTRALNTLNLAIKHIDFNLSLIDKLLIIFILLIVSVLFLIAFISPVNNVDSLLYHMSRVVHWAQNQSIDHYVARFDHELLKPPWAEMAILNLRVLWGSDQPANLVQWFSLVGSLIAVSGIAGSLVSDRRAQILAAIVALSVPMGMLQATTTQNDYAVTFWVVSMAYWIVLSQKHDLKKLEFAAFAGAFGLGLLTKGTFFVYGPVLIAWYLLSILLRRSYKRVLFQGTLLLLTAVVLNSGFWIRNIQTYGGPYGTVDWLSANIPFIPKPDPIASTPPAEIEVNTDIDERVVGKIAGRVRWIVTREAKTMALNYVTPFHFVNQQVRHAFEQVPAFFEEPWLESTDILAWNNEDTASNPLHALLIPVTLVMLFILSRKKNVKPLAIYAGICLLTFLMIPIVIGHGISIWGLRYQLPFWVLWSPVVGGVFTLALVKRPFIYYLFAFGLLLYTLPYILINNMKPIIGLTPWPTRVNSILTADPNEILFASVPEYRDEYEFVTNEIESAACDQVGLALSSRNLEYMFWWLLDAPQSGTQLKNLTTNPRMERYADPSFKPCAVICTFCQGEEDMKGIPLFGDYGHIQLFIEPRDD